MAKSPCITCGRLARPYGQGICRTCWKARERAKLSELRQKVEMSQTLVSEVQWRQLEDILESLRTAQDAR